MEEIIIMGENITVIRDPKTFCFHFDWPKDGDENLKHEIEFILNKKLNKKRDWTKYIYVNISMATILMNTENSKMNEPHKFVLNLSQRLELRS